MAIRILTDAATREELERPLDEVETDEHEETADPAQEEEEETEPSDDEDGKNRDEDDREETEEEEEEEEEETPPALKKMQGEMDSMKRKLELAEAKASHFQRAHDKLAGRYSALRKKSGDASAAKDEDDEDEETVEPRKGRGVDDETQETIMALRVEMFRRIGQEEEDSLVSDYPEIKDLSEVERRAFATIVQENTARYKTEFRSSDPDLIRSASRLSLREAWDQFSAKMKSERRKAIVERNKRSEEKLRRTKRLASDIGASRGREKATGAGSGGRVKPEDMSIEEIHKAMKRLGRRGF